MHLVCQNCKKEVPPRRNEDIGKEQTCPHCGVTPLRRKGHDTQTENLTIRDSVKAVQKSEGYRGFKVRIRQGWSYFRKGAKWVTEKFVMDKSKNWKYQSYKDEKGEELHPGGAEDTVIDPSKPKGFDLKK